MFPISVLFCIVFRMMMMFGSANKLHEHSEALNGN